MKRILLLILTASLVSMAMAEETTVSYLIRNTSKTDRTDQPVVIDLKSFGHVASAIVQTDGKEIPCQLDDLDQDGENDELCFLVDSKGCSETTYQVTLYDTGTPLQYPARVYTEMLIRNDKVKEKNKHDNYIESITARGDCANSYNIQHHHGVTFESELNGIRIYFDKRQTLDLYGKYQKRLEIQATQFYTSAEQKAAGYGDDVLWVGNTFGLGAFRGWDGQQPTMIDPVRSRTQRIISYGPLRTIVEVVDKGWQPYADKSTVDMTIRYTQYAGHRDTDVDVFFNKEVSDYLFSTGIINVKGSEEYSDGHGLRACWGSDWPSSDTINFKRETVGLGIYIPMRYVKSEEKANKDNYAFVVGTPDEVPIANGCTDKHHLSYKVVYSSDNETFGYHSAQEWFDYLRRWKKEVDTPLIVVRHD